MYGSEKVKYTCELVDRHLSDILRWQSRHRPNAAPMPGLPSQH